MLTQLKHILTHFTINNFYNKIFIAYKTVPVTIYEYTTVKQTIN